MRAGGKRESCDGKLVMSRKEGKDPQTKTEGTREGEESKRSEYQVASGSGMLAHPRKALKMLPGPPRRNPRGS